MADYDLYGVNAETLEAARTLITRAIPLCFQLHDSSYVGDYYLASGEGEETFKLRENVDPIDGEPAEMDYPGYRFLLYVDDSHRSDTLRQTMFFQPHIALLRHESL